MTVTTVAPVTRVNASAPLAIFDLDHTLLSGDSDELWCAFLIAHGLIDAAAQQRNTEMVAAYRAGTVSVAAFSGFYVGLLAGRSPAFWAPWCERFLHEAVLPRIPPAAWALVQQHRAAGHTLVMSTATQRVITERTAAALAIPHLIATEVQTVGGLYTGQPEGVLNMREGKVQRLRQWLADQGLAEAPALADAHFYSDSINDLPLLLAVGQPVVVDPDPRLQREAAARGWPVLRWRP